MLIDVIAGARPNFMKIAPIIEEIVEQRNSGTNMTYRLIHTGQHYDESMSESFFKQLGIPTPDINLGVGSGSQAEQTGGIMLGYENVVNDRKPDVCLVVGDVTSTMACTITARKLGVLVAHVEAGIRSGDWTMPEEINRVVTDSITNLFFTTTASAGDNLLRSGVDSEKIHLVGNTMIDTLLKHRSSFKRPEISIDKNLVEKKYLVLTMHRPANVDSFEEFSLRLETISRSAKGVPIVFPVHPRTAAILANNKIDFENIHMTEPLSYLEFNYLVDHSMGVLTDSGGITEETTVMGVPCITMRDSTERPETVIMGTNELIGTSLEAIPEMVEKIITNNWKKGSIPPLWDGSTGKRIVEVLRDIRRR